MTPEFIKQIVACEMGRTIVYFRMENGVLYRGDKMPNNTWALDVKFSDIVSYQGNTDTREECIARIVSLFEARYKPT